MARAPALKLFDIYFITLQDPFFLYGKGTKIR